MKNAFDGLLKVLYVMPAIFVGTIYGFVLVIGGYENLAPFSWAIPLLYVTAAILLFRGKWWGCIPGIAAGLLITGGFSVSLPIEAQVYNFYFVIMGDLCYFTSRKKEEFE